MPRGIARRDIAGRASIARKPIASVYAAQSTQTAAASPQQFPPGSYTFTPTVSGWWKFVLWGAGGGYSGAAGGGSGSYCEITKFLTTGQTVALVVGVGGYESATAPTNSTATFPDGTVATAGAGTNAGAAGTATGGDVNLSGSASGVAGLGTGGGAAGTGAAGGAGAPANLPFRGGAGGNDGGIKPAKGPGAGGAGSASAAAGGDGLIIAFLARS